MNQPDELERLWKTQPVAPAVKGEEMRKIIVMKTEKFDRMIKRRNGMESAVALGMAAFFAVAAWKQPSGLMRLGSGIIVAGLLWIVYYIRRHGTEAPEPHPDQTLAGYQRALISKYDHQTRLLRNAKFWYLLPLYLGLLTSSAGMLKAHAAEGALTWMDAIGPLVYTLVFAGVWWLNEVHAVRKLQKMRAQVLSATEETQC